MSINEKLLQEVLDNSLECLLKPSLKPKIADAVTEIYNSRMKHLNDNGWLSGDVDVYEEIDEALCVEIGIEQEQKFFKDIKEQASSVRVINLKEIANELRESKQLSTMKIIFEEVVTELVKYFDDRINVKNPFMLVTPMMQACLVIAEKSGVKPATGFVSKHTYSQKEFVVKVGDLEIDGYSTLGLVRQGIAREGNREVGNGIDWVILGYTDSENQEVIMEKVMLKEINGI